MWVSNFTIKSTLNLVIARINFFKKFTKLIIMLTIYFNSWLKKIHCIHIEEYFY